MLEAIATFERGDEPVPNARLAAMLSLPRQNIRLKLVAPAGHNLIEDDAAERKTAIIRLTARRRREKLHLTHLDVAVSCHADADHSTGLIPAVGLLKPRLFINNGLAGSTATWARLVNVATQAGVQGIKVADQRLRMGDVTI